MILRYFTVYGPGQRPDMAFHRFAEAALRRLPAPLHGDGSQVRDFTYVDDVVAATIAAAERGSGVLNVGGGSPASLNEALAHIGDIAGVPVPVVPSPTARGHVAQHLGRHDPRPRGPRLGPRGGPARGARAAGGGHARRRPGPRLARRAYGGRRPADPLRRPSAAP